MKRSAHLFILFLLISSVLNSVMATLPAAASEAQSIGSPKLSKERVILQTSFGNIVLALYPEVAPKHVAQLLNLFRLGVYNSINFYRLETGFLAQLSDTNGRRLPLTQEQRAAIHPIQAEFSQLRHRAGSLSMARRDDQPNSGETSFSILMVDAPHLDGKYTIFGEVQGGMEVVAHLFSQAKDSEYHPLSRIEILKTVVVSSPDALELISVYTGQTLGLSPGNSQGLSSGDELFHVPLSLAAGIAMIVLISILQVMAASKLSRAGQRALSSTTLLVAAFLLLMAVTRYGQQHTVVAILTFLGLLGILKLMNQFELPNPKS